VLERDYYVILGIPQEESQSGIQKAFRRLVKRYHPDIVGPKWKAQYQDVVEAYQVLSDPDRRESYNRGLEQAQGRPPRPGQTIVTGYDLEPEPLVPGPVSLVRDFRTASDPFEALIDRFFRNFTGDDVPKAEREQSLTMEIILSPDEALRGGRLPLNVPMVYPCPYCDGTGRVWPYSCGHCSGQGVISDEETVTLVIPPRVRGGTVFEIPLQGLGIHNIRLMAMIRIGTQDQ
jgi:molecular chaperone DnaJ